MFGTIHPDIFRLRAPIGAQPLLERVRVASLEPQVGLGALLEEEDASDVLETVSFEERFSGLDSGGASFEERFASLDRRFASLDERFGLSTRELRGVLRVSPSQDIRNAFRSDDRLLDSPMMAPAAPHVRPGQPRKDSLAQIEDDGRTAIYDITARTVYLPNGRRLEAHSGLGSMMDNPRHVHVRMHGATPPNVYRLTLRESLFHGVRAIRLNPVDGNKMHGRAGILAHTYMLGPSGQSNGCVSFKNYSEFLNAYLRGEVTRLVVVDHLDNPPNSKVASSGGWLPDVVKKLFTPSDSGGQYASGEY